MNLDRRLLSLAGSVQLYLALSVGAGLLAGAATVLQAAYLSRTVAGVFLEGRSIEDVAPLLLALAAAIVIRAALTWTRDVAASRAAARIKADLRERLFARLLALGPAYAWGERTGELANTATEGIEALDAYFSQYLPNLALAALIPITVLLFVFPLDLVSALVFLLTAPLIPIFMVLIGRLADLLTKRQWEALSRLSAHFLDVLQGLTTLKLFGRSREQIEVIARISDRHRTTTMGVLRVAFLSALVLEMLATISTAVVAVEVGLRLLYATISFEQAFFVLILAPEFYLPLRNLGSSFHAGMSGAAAAARIFEVLGARDGEQLKQDGQDKRDGQDQETGSLGPLKGKNLGTHPPHQSNPVHPVDPVHPCFSPSPRLVRFEEVHYAYERGERPALKGATLEIARGERVALVGPSGSGKSTVAHLLLRFIEPDGGQILVDGVPLSAVPIPWWREQVGWVPQNPYLFHGTVAENLLLARPGAPMQDVVRAARMAHAHEFIAALPQGYGTPIGERGARLSGGEAQRLALARAFLKDAPLLILDEATSALDPEQEALVQDAVERLARGRTVLAIAHRLATVRGADRIVVLSGGRVAEVGTHSELLRRGGLYRGLVAACGGASEQAGERKSERAREQERGRASGGGSEQASVQEGEQASGRASERGGAREIWQLLSLMAPFKGWVALSVLLGFATVASGIGLMATAAFIIASAALHPSVADLAVPIVGVRFFGISRAAFRYLERYVSHDVNFRLLARLRVWFYQALEPLAPARLMERRSGDLLSRVVADVETLQNFYVRVVAPPAVALLVAIFMAAFMQRYDAGLADALMAFFVLAGVGVPLLAWRLSLDVGRRVAGIRSELTARLVDGIQGMADLLAFGQGERHLDGIRSLSEAWVKAQGRMAWIAGLHGAMGSLLANLGMWTVLVIAIPLVSGGRLEGVYLPVLVLAALASFEAVLPLPLAFQHLESSLEAGRRLFEIAGGDGKPDVRGQKSEVGSQKSEVRGQRSGTGVRGAGGGDRLWMPAGDRPAAGARNLVVEDLRFRYGLGEPWALDGISFQLPPGGRLAMVGPSGSGKSTLVHLLLRFWDYQQGRIVLGGRDLRQHAPEELYRLIGVVSQRTHLFNATIRDNLLLARPDAPQEEMIEAARHAHLHPFVETLPRGYDTWIGEQGLRLSGGERQRLAIARALLKDAPILLLDEPTANLDSLVEREVVRSIRALMEGRTTIVATHRLVGLESMDEILVLRAGRISERGRHDELLRADGQYRRMWELQNQLVPVDVR